VTYYPQSASGLNYITYPVATTPNTITTITSSASTNTKGSYAEIVASTGFACNSLYVAVPTTAPDNQYYLLDIATGAAAAETVVIQDMILNGLNNTSADGGSLTFYPLAIAASTRISGRCQCSVASQTLGVAVTLVAAGDTPGCASFVANGAATGTSQGTTIDPGAVADTKGAYSVLTASLAAVAQYMTLMFTPNANSVPNNFIWAVDLATGAAASEVILIPDMRIRAATTTPTKLTGYLYHFPTYIAASTRLAMRASCSGTDTTDRKFQTAAYTATAPAETSGGESAAAFFGAF